MVDVDTLHEVEAHVANVVHSEYALCDLALETDVHLVRARRSEVGIESWADNPGVKREVVAHEVRVGLRTQCLHRCLVFSLQIGDERAGHRERLLANARGQVNIVHGLDGVVGKSKETRYLVR